MSISEWEIKLIKLAAVRGGFTHDAISTTINCEWALRGLVKDGFMDAWGSREWSNAHFTLTKKGIERYGKLDH